MTDEMLDDVGAFLASHGHGTVGTNIFKGLMPDDPDTVIAVFEYSGGEPAQTLGLNTAVVYERYSLQVVSRDTDYVGARDAARAVFATLQTVANETVNGTRFIRIEPRQSPFMQGRDGKRRVLFACNYSVER